MAIQLLRSAGRQRAELLLDLIVRHELVCVRLPKTFVDPREETQPLDRIVDRRVFREGPKRVDGPLLLGCLHGRDSTIVRIEVAASAQL